MKNWFVDDFLYRTIERGTGVALVATINRWAHQPANPIIILHDTSLWTVCRTLIPKEDMTGHGIPCE